MYFDGYESKKASIDAFCKKYKIKDLPEAKSICDKYDLDVFSIVRSIQNICFENACWSYTLGCASVLKNGIKSANEVAMTLGEGLQAFCAHGSVADKRKVGIGHGILASKLLDENIKSFCFLAGHESFAAAKGALGIAQSAMSVRKNPLKVVLNGLGKDAAYIIARINGFTYRKTQYNFETNKLEIEKDFIFSSSDKSKVIVYGADSVEEGVEIMKYEKVQISITGNSTNPVRYTHPVAGIYKKYCYENGIDYYSIASGGGTGRTLHPDNVGAGPASYGLTDVMGRMHCDIQFAGSSSVPAHVNMMGFIGMGNNPIVGATVTLTTKLVEITNRQNL